MPERVVLLHGLWMRGFAMGLLQHRLAEADFMVERFDYLSVGESGPKALIDRTQHRRSPCQRRHHPAARYRLQLRTG